MLRIRIITLLALLAGLNSCSTDFDLVAPYEDHTIVFGLLDQNETTHFIKVNKAFLGDGNAYDYTGVRDSSEYTQVIGRVEEWNGSSLVNSFPLADTVITDKDSGLFYYPTQTLYYFNATLNENHTYKLVLSLNDGTKEVNGETVLVKGSSFYLYPPTSSPQIPIGMAFANSSIDNNYPDYTFKYSSGVDAREYDLWLYMYYDEYTASGTTRKELTWKIDENVTTTLSGGEIREKKLNGQAFYNFLASRINDNTNVIKRVFRQLDILIVGAADDFYTYMKINAPSTGIVQEKPSFTNLDNAIGIFSSRYSYWVRGKVLNKDSQKELCTGQYTNQLLFCHDSIVWSGENFYCP